MVSENFESELVRIGKRIRVIRKHRGLTLLDLATLSGISDSMLSRYERGLENIGLQILYRIAKELKVSIKQLADYDGSLPDNVNWRSPLPKRSKKRM
ncbi:helix-turn-helix domain-containing protein [Paraflavitalea pollutisoli]|uniref:helix-turn-helix domain-containing protein n=1 Tax=Paraflavitalea pollutisoli TaxID=3034143 RepID=UPI003B82D06B